MARWTRLWVMWVCLVARGAAAQSEETLDAEASIDAAHAEAMEAYQQLDLERALERLGSALELAEREGTPAAQRARLHVSLGVVLAAGVGDRRGAYDQFMQALCLDHGAELDPLLATPDVVGLFESAHIQAGQRCATEDAAATPRRKGWDPELPPVLKPKPPPAAADDGTPVSPFLRVGMALGLALVRDGMPADRPPHGLAPGDEAACCLELAREGVVAHEAARLALGLRIDESFALAALLRVQLRAGHGDLAGILLGGRVEQRLWRASPTGPSVSLFGGATAGQIQVEAPETGAYAISGTAGVHLGTALRYPAGEHLALVLAPELDLQFPTTMLNTDLTLSLELR